MSPLRTPVSADVEAIDDARPFVGPEALQRASGKIFAARLGANESAFGPSPASGAAMAAAAADVWMYGDPDNHELKVGLAAHHQLPASRISVGEGIDGLLGNIAQFAVTPGIGVVTSDGAYPTFNHHIALRGGVLHKVAYRNGHEDLAALSDAVKRTAARIVYLTNPDNPMGTWWAASDIEAFCHGIADDVLVLLDEAYCDTAPADTIPHLSAENGIGGLGNVVRLRTFSKAYGLAGARVGYAIAHPEMTRLFDAVRNDYGVNRLGQIGALAALIDQPHLHAVVRKIAAARERLYAIAADSGLKAVPSATNFVAIDCGCDAAFAERVLQSVQHQGVFIRKPRAQALATHIRVSVAPDAALDLFAEALPKALHAAASSA